MKIGVTGASGHLGRAVVSELLQRSGGHEVMDHADARKRLWTGSGTIRGLQPARNPRGGLCGSRSSALATVVSPPGCSGRKTSLPSDVVKAGVKQVANVGFVPWPPGMTVRTSPASRAASYRDVDGGMKGLVDEGNFYLNCFVQQAQGH